MTWLLASLGLGFGFIFRFDLASELDFGLTWHFGWIGLASIRMAIRLARLFEWLGLGYGFASLLVWLLSWLAFWLGMLESNMIIIHYNIKNRTDVIK